MGLLSNTGVILDVAAMMCVSSGITPRPGRPMYMIFLDTHMRITCSFIFKFILYIHITYLYFIVRHKFI